MQKTPDIFDYAVCFMIADLITASIFSGSILWFTFGVGWYILVRETQSKNDFVMRDN